MLKLAVMVSGSGSILEAMLAADLPVALVVADRPCRGLEIASWHNVATTLVDRKHFGRPFDRAKFTAAIQSALDAAAPDLVAMAGFMTVLGPAIFKSYGGRIINTHPSLLPDFRGDHAVRDCLASGAATSGCTIHIATPELDAGPILAQATVQVLPGDTEASLHERIKRVERQLYPETLAQMLLGRVPA